MSDDEESAVRRRLSRLFEPRSRHEPARPTFDQVPATPRRDAGPRPVPGEPDGIVPPASRSALVESDAPVPLATGLAEAALADGTEQESPRTGRLSRLPGPGAFDPGRRGVRALAVVAAVVVLVAGIWAWRSRPRAEPVRPVATVAASDGTQPSPAAPSGASGEVVVAVAGKVRRPGLVRLPAGARVADAVEAAGGALPGVDVALLNPARKVTDGELILVGVAAPPGQAGQPGQPGQPPADPAAGAGAPAGLVNLNTATVAQLDALPGVGPVLAQRILDHRERHGGFRSVSDLRQVEGIGDTRYERLKDLVTV
ncbi:ComEA family DNA-binding protein [Micromonospora narathiwatensis]|uniref:ComEA family DNA-binding protein n=1 Tax=Micromonospora narathiwatensis TaxID=299146 RepID=UPI000B86B813|nr:ComEA family DNA-binding protein [Micromonospora narathiwatensis]